MLRSLRSASAIASVSLVTATLIGCAQTQPEAITTVGGPVLNGVIARPLVILGVLQLSTTSGNLPNGHASHSTQVAVEVPVGTVAILPALKGWTVGYGSAQPNSAHPDTSIDWQPTDHNWGLGSIEVSVVRINPPNMVVRPPTQTAELSVLFLLTDDNGDAPWFGGVSYTLICLGVQGQPFAAWQPIPFGPPRLEIQPNPR